MSPLSINPISPALGAEVSGVDLQQLSEKTAAEIRQLLLAHKVLFFRDQDLDPERLHRAASHFGLPVPYPFVDGVPGFPEIIEVLKLPEEKANFGGVWHSDTTYLPEPAMGALLFADELPPVGGDTLFANMALAWQSLSTGMQEMLSGLRAVFDADKPSIAATRVARATSEQRGLVAIHPVKRIHPETGEPLLYVSRAHTTRFEGWTEAESADLLSHLFEVQAQPEISCRFTWREGSVAFWDNRVCQHYPLNDYHGYRRRLLRVSLAGDAPV